MRLILILFFSISIQSLNAQHNGIDPMNWKNSIQSKTACNPTDSFRLVSDWPASISFDGSHYWVIANNFKIYKYNSLGVLIDSINHPNRNASFVGGGISTDNNFIWVLCEDIDSIYKLNKNTGLRVHSFSASLSGDGFGICKLESKLFVSMYGSTSYIFEIDTISGAILDTIVNLNNRFLLGMTDFEGNLFACANSSSQQSNLILRIDTSNGNVLDSIQVCIPYPLGLTKKNNKLWLLSSEINYGGREMAYEIDSLIPLTTSIKKHKDESTTINYYPNPIEDYLIVEMPEGEKQISVYSLNGKLEFDLSTNKTVKQINMKDLASGIYLIKISSLSFSTSFKILK